MAYHYLLNGPLLKITCSDSEQEHVDERRIQDGPQTHHVQQFDGSGVSKLWRKQLGKGLAIKFLLKPESGMYPTL